jgi:protein-L-isoaspartate(D-aspartate) O-methyltransferase
MVDEQLAKRDITDHRVLSAMAVVPRHRFVPAPVRADAYDDRPLPIDAGQTISQPYIVAFTLQALDLRPGATVLDVGTGSGYQAAVLAEIADSVFTIEIIPELAQAAAKRLKELGYTNVVVKQGDGYNGWPEKAPFDAIIVTAAPPKIPPPLLEQLKRGGTMVLPVGEYVQELVVVKKNESGMTMQNILPVRFVPMTGKVQKDQ